MKGEDIIEEVVSGIEPMLGMAQAMPDGALCDSIAKAAKDYLDSEKADDPKFQISVCALFFLIPEYRRRQREKAKATKAKEN